MILDFLQWCVTELAWQSDDQGVSKARGVCMIYLTRELAVEHVLHWLSQGIARLAS